LGKGGAQIIVHVGGDPGAFGGELLLVFERLQVL